MQPILHSTSFAFITQLVQKTLLTPLHALWKSSSTLTRRGLIFPTAFALFNYTCCKYRLFPHRIFYQVWFSTTTVGTLFTSFVVAAFPAHILAKLGIIQVRTAEKVAAAAVSFAAKALVALNPQMRVHCNYDRVDWSHVPKHSLVSANHTSYLDAFIYSAIVPTFKNYIHQKGFMKGSLRKIPVAGYLFFEILGQFPVHYHSDELENFSVDKEKQAKELNRVLSWIGQDEQNSFVYSPEGRVNPNPIEIQELRYGFLKVIFENTGPQTAFFHVTFWPAHEFWGRNDFTGGSPCDLVVTMAEYRVPRDDPKISRDGKTLDDVSAFASHLRSFMQQELNRAREMHSLILLEQRSYRTAADWWRLV